MHYAVYVHTCDVHVSYSTIKSNCPVFIRLQSTYVNNDPVLRVVETELRHNHPLSPELNSMLPQNRRLTDDELADLMILASNHYWPQNHTHSIPCEVHIVSRLSFIRGNNTSFSCLLLSLFLFLLLLKLIIAYPTKSWNSQT